LKTSATDEATEEHVGRGWVHTCMCLMILLFLVVTVWKKILFFQFFFFFFVKSEAALFTKLSDNIMFLFISSVQSFVLNFSNHSNNSLDSWLCLRYSFNETTLHELKRTPRRSSARDRFTRRRRRKKKKKRTRPRRDDDFLSDEDTDSRLVQCVMKKIRRKQLQEVLIYK